MGAHFGSIHMRGVDRETVREALAEVARTLDCRFLLAPETDGWVIAFPSGDGHDAAVSEEFARRFHCDVLHTMLYHSDVFYYYYYREGKLRDQYSSRPDCFGKVSAKVRKSLRGQPACFSHLLRDPGDLPAMETLLTSEDPDDPFFAHTLMGGFADLLGLSYSDTSYEILQADGADEIAEWDRFVHVPDLGPERARLRAAEDAVEAEFEAHRRRGLLLFDESPAPRAIVPHPSQEGFVALSSPDSLRETGRLFSYGPPWKGGTEFSGVSCEWHPWDIGTSPSGRCIALGGESGGSKTGLWELGCNRLLAELDGEAQVHLAGFTAEGDVVSASDRTIRIFSAGNGREIRRIDETVYNGVIAVHPSQPVLVSLRPGGPLAVIDYRTGHPIKTFYLEHLGDFSYMQLMQRAMFGGLLKQHQAKAARDLRKVASISGADSDIPEWGTVPFTAEAPRQLLFSADGRFLFCATDKAGWVFDWDALLASQDPAPQARYRFRAQQTASIMPTFDTTTMVLGLAHDARRNLLLLGVGDGSIHQIDLETGADNVLLAVPGQIPVRQLGLSNDGTVLYTILSPGLKDLLPGIAAIQERCRGSLRQPPFEPQPDRFQIWDYAKLLACRASLPMLVK